MFKKLLIALITVVALGSFTMQPANAYGGPHYGYGGYGHGYGGRGYGYGPGPALGFLGLGLLGGVAIGEALAPPVYVQPAPTVVYVQPTCRQVQQNMIINGQYTPVVSNVCLGPDGVWR